MAFILFFAGNSHATGGVGNTSKRIILEIHVWQNLDVDMRAEDKEMDTHIRNLHLACFILFYCFILLCRLP